MSEIVLTGLDGSNPLAYLAALGVVVALDDAGHPVTLHWELDGVWRPVLTTVGLDFDAVLDVVDADRKARLAESVLCFTYPKKNKEVADVKVPPDLLHETLEQWARETSRDSRRTVDWFTALVSEGSVDNNGAAKPTALHFTAGQQQFLKAARTLYERSTRDDLQVALMGPWLYDRPLPVMGWDNTEFRDYAFRARDPSSDKKLGVPGADVLALRGLVLFPTAPRGGRQQTAGARGGWKTGSWTWAVWGPRASRTVVGAIVLTPRPDRLSAEARRRRGILQVFETKILRSDQGGYGSVTPAQPR